MRVYDRNLGLLPVAVDLYGLYARVTDYSPEGLADDVISDCCDIVRRMCYIQSDHVVFMHRLKREGRQQHGLQAMESLKVPVKESGYSFTVDLTSHIDTGLFLDHMRTRQMVGEMSKGLKVLNLFSYTGAFSVYAAGGGAREVVSVDLSGPSTAWARQNLGANGFIGDMYRCIQSDALKFIIEALKNNEIYDLIIFDPPSFSNSHRMDEDFDVRRDYVRYFDLLNNLLSPEGTMVFSTNLSTFQMDSGRVRGFDLEQITKSVAAPGFTKNKGTSRTWILKKIRNITLRKKDWVGYKRVPSSENGSDDRILRNAKEFERMDTEEKKDENFELNDQQEIDASPVEKTDQDAALEGKSEQEDAVQTKESDESQGSESSETEATEVTAESTEENNYDNIIKSLDSDQETDSDNGMLSLRWDDSEPVKVATSEPKPIESLKDRKKDSDMDDQKKRDLDKVFSSHGSRRDDGSAGRGDRDRRDFGDNRRDDRRSPGRFSDGDRSRRSRDDDRGGYGSRRFRDDDRGGYGSRRSRDDDRGGYGSRSRDNDRGYGSRGSRDDDRGGYGSRRSRDDDRGGYGSRSRDNDRGYGSRGSRDDDRGGYGSRSRDNDRGYGSRGYRDDDRGGYGSRSRDNDRGYGSRGYRDDDRGGYGSRRYHDDDRGYGSRSRDNDRGYGSRGYRDDDRGGYGSRRYHDDDRGGYDRRSRDDSGYRGDRERRESRYDMDRRKKKNTRSVISRDGGVKPYGFEKFEKTHTRGEDESQFFWLDEKKES
jgi:23S rRNA G2069 N7-methylase RlmK/C1962 C5-methylase RlmI